ncbi:MAG: cytochrome c oxidase accessory protein CcoG [Acidobacteriota bacterium]
MIPLDEVYDSFRNELASVAADGRRRWIYARQPAGRYYTARTAVAALLVTFLFAAPFVTIGGQPLMLLNVIERRFVLLGIVFPPQDLYLLVLIALSALVTLALVTVVAGRIWCGWLCPQTVFLEMLFRRIEYLIDGSAEQQLRRNRGPWTADRVRRTVLKQTLFLALSLIIANVFLAWVIGAAAVRALIADTPAHHPAGFTAMMIFTTVFYLVFARFREQACVLACPYGRMMSALLDRRTVTVTYDYRRGEPRGRRTAAAVQPATGDCVDCHRCVTVCPTGIDIRNGIQLECVSCAACVDACDDVMTRVGKPVGLIRHTSAERVESGGGRWVTARAVGYAIVWLVLVVTVGRLVATRADLDVLVLRQAGTMYVALPGGDVANFYTVQALNRTSHPATFSVDVLEPRGAIATPLGPLGSVGPHALQDGRLLIRVPRTSLVGSSTPVRVRINAPGHAALFVESSFLGPPAGGQ